MNFRSVWTRCLVLGVLLGLLSGCSTHRSYQPANTRPFRFDTDTFAYANELLWNYYYDANGHWRHSRNEEEHDYTHHCFVVARSARQFFQFARFDASLPRADEQTYRRLIKEVVSRDPAKNIQENERIVIPGYADLRSFSEDHQQLLKDTCGGVLQSYFQRGHWRMVFPFSRSGQEHEAEALATAIASNRPPVVHVLTFPSLHINHALLLFGCHEDKVAFRFSAYDPNNPKAPVELTFDKATRTFRYPPNNYWKGGKLSVYEVYRAWNY